MRVVLVALALFLGTSSLQAQGNGRPKIEASSYVADLGELLYGERRDYTFTIKNIGDAPLRFDRVVGSCACIVPLMTIGDVEVPISDLLHGRIKTPLMPGASADFKVQLKTATITDQRKDNPDFRRSIRIYTNDVAQNPLQLFMEAYLVEGVHFEPGKLKFPPVRKSQTQTVSTRFWPTRLDDLKVRGTVASHKGYEVHVKQVDTREGKPVFQMDVTVDPSGMKVGKRRDSVILDLDDDRVEELYVPMTLEVLPDVDFRGNSETQTELLDFGQIKPGEEHSLELNIENTNPTVPYIPTGVEISAKPTAKPFRYELIEIEAGVRYKIRLTVAKDIKVKLFRGTIRVLSDHPDSPRREAPFKGMMKRSRRP